MSRADRSEQDRSQGLGRRRVDELRDTLERYFIMLPNSMYGTWLDAISGRPDTVKPGNKARFLQRGAY